MVTKNKFQIKKDKDFDVKEVKNYVYDNSISIKVDNQLNEEETFSKKEIWAHVKEFEKLIEKELNASWNRKNVELLSKWRADELVNEIKEDGKIVNAGLDSLRNDLNIHLFEKIQLILKEGKCFDSYNHWSNTVKKILQNGIIDLKNTEMRKAQTNNKYIDDIKDEDASSMTVSGQAYEYVDSRDEKEKVKRSFVELIYDGYDQENEDKSFENLTQKKLYKDYEDENNQLTIDDVLNANVLSKREKDLLFDLLSSDNFETKIHENNYVSLIKSIKMKFNKYKR